MFFRLKRSGERSYVQIVGRVEEERGCLAMRRRPVSPGEFHPEPLTDPDVRLSLHPARAAQRRLAPSGKAVGFLRSPVDPTNAASDPPPSLDGRYPRFITMGRSAPPDPSVFSASRVHRLSPFPLAWPRRVSSCVTKAQMRVTPPEHWTPHGQSVGIPHANPEASGRPRFRCRRSSFRCVVRG